MPTDTVLPHIVYQNVADAIAWLATAFGFIEHYRYGDPEGPISGAQMHLGEAWIMLNRVRAGRASPAQVGFETQSLTVFVDDVDAHFQRAKSAGARIVEDLHETVYGELQYGAEDLDGHHWLFSQHARDVSPGEWGAKIAERRGVLPEMAPIGREASWPGRPAPPGSPGAARLGPPPRE
ncbi:MAG TPA: VOC family protein [Terriglobia bacterium]|nr:VOC family protein [Terriglobia bacterium]